MKLIAIQAISDQLPPGAAFEIPDDDAASAHALIEAGLARKDLVAEDSQAPGEPASPPAPGRRPYRRRDLKAED